jgi:hypothetical protein
MRKGRKECVRGRESVGKEGIISGWSERRKWGKKGKDERKGMGVFGKSVWRN